MVAIPLVAWGVALLLLLVAYALVVLFTPIIEGVLREIPFVGGVLAHKAKSALDWAANKVVQYANTGTRTIERWTLDLVASTRDFVAAVNAYLVELPDQLDHLVHVTVHEIVKAFVNPVRDIAHAAAADATSALASVEAFVDAPLTHFRGIEHGVDNRLGHLQDIIENVDLPDLQRTLDREIARAAGAVSGEVADLGALVDDGFTQLWDFIGRIPLQQLLALLTAVPILASVVQVIEAEAGLGNAACRAKVKGICATDPGAWSALLDVVGLAVAWVGIAEFVALAQDFARESVPSMLDLVHGR